MEIQTTEIVNNELKKTDEIISFLSKKLILIRKELELLFSNEDASLESIESLADTEMETSQEISRLSQENLFLSILRSKSQELQN